MKVLELFAGSKSIGNAANKLNLEVFSSDITAFNGIDYVVDILNFDVKKVPFRPDIVWASPPCEKWSLACGVKGGNIYFESIKEKGKIIGIKHRENFNVKSNYKLIDNPEKVKELALHSMLMVDKTIEIIKYFNPKFYFIENPFGYMQYYLKGKVDYVNFATYCQYGFPYRKPTNIFSNIELNLKSCSIGDACHSNNLYTRGKNNKIREKSVVNTYYDRSKIPTELCLDILKQAIDYKI